MIDTNTQEMFWSKVAKGDPEDCWPWTGVVTTGRGRIRGMVQINGKPKMANRISATLVHGEPEDGQVCMHSCDNPICVNPAHLKWATQKENMEDCSAKKRASGMTKTHCIKGHPLEAGNLLKRVNGRRNCAKCQAIRQAAYRAAKKGENHVGN